MRRLWAGLLALLMISLAHSQDDVEPVSQLKFQILSESSVQMSWTRPRSRVQGFRITVHSDSAGASQQLLLPPSASHTSLTSLSPLVDYSVSIVSFDGPRESAAVWGQITLQASGGSRDTWRKPAASDAIKCPVSSASDLMLLLDLSLAPPPADLRAVRSLFAAVADAFVVAAGNTRVGVVTSYGGRARSEFSLSDHMTRPALNKAIAGLTPPGHAHTGGALLQVLQKSFSPEAGARSGFPKVLVLVSDGPSLDPAQVQTLRQRGVEVFALGVPGADEVRLRLVASAPHQSHVFSASSFENLRHVQRNLLQNICSGVERQLSALGQGGEVVEPPSGLEVVEVSSKSVRVRWRPPQAQVSGYRLQLEPLAVGGARQELYVQSSAAAATVTGLSPDTPYSIHLSALRDLSASERITAAAATPPITVSLECSLGVDVAADVVFLVDGSYSIGLANFAKVRAFLEVLVKSFDIGPNKVQISLVQYSRDPHPEFYLNTHQDLEAVLRAVRSFPYRGGSTNTGRALTYVRERVLQASRGARAHVPTVTILITDGKSSDAFRDSAHKLRSGGVEVFAVGVKDAVRSELESIANDPSETHVFTVEDFDAFERISRELSQSICLRIEQELRQILQRQLPPPRSLSLSDVSPRSLRASWEMAPPAEGVRSFLLRFGPAPGGGAAQQYVSMSVGGDTRSAVLPHLTPLTRYQVQVQAQYERGDSAAVSGAETTLSESGPPQDLVTSDVTDSGFSVSWAAAPGPVRSYSVRWKSQFSSESGLKQVPGAQTRTVLEGLSPETLYQVWVKALYGERESEEVSGEERTEAPPSARRLAVSEETERSFKASWTPAPGPVLHYRLRHVPINGGREVSLKVPPTQSSAHLKKLRPSTSYSVVVVPVYARGEGKASVSVQTAQEPPDLRADPDQFQGDLGPGSWVCQGLQGHLPSDQR